MRLFISINLDNNIKDALLSVQDAMRLKGVRGNFTRPENMHLTLAFVGEYSDPDYVKDVIDSIVMAPFDIGLNGMGAFGSLWWVGIEKNDRLETLARILRRRLAEADIPFDKKRFSPHITIVRKPESVLPLTPGDYADILRGKSMMVDHISLMRSDRGKSGMIYTEL